MRQTFRIGYLYEVKPAIWLLHTNLQVCFKLPSNRCCSDAAEGVYQFSIEKLLHVVKTYRISFTREFMQELNGHFGVLVSSTETQAVLLKHRWSYIFPPCKLLVWQRSFHHKGGVLISCGACLHFRSSSSSRQTWR